MFEYDPKVANQKVKCISPREAMPDQIREGEIYTLDRLSVWIDTDGDAYGTFYDMKGDRVGQLKLSHFCTV